MVGIEIVKSGIRVLTFKVYKGVRNIPRNLFINLA